MSATWGHTDPATLAGNRPRRLPVGPFALRRQGMSDHALKPRLDPAISLEQWRGFINDQVFLFPTEAAARRFARSEPEDQAILRFDTDAILRAAPSLRACRFNNGYIDRRPRTRPRLRSFGDYVPVAHWTGPVCEVVVMHEIPPGTPFSILPAS